MEQETKEQRPYIFVSYSSKDKDKVLPIAEEIERQGYNVWVDSGNDGIAGGDVLARTIEERIQNCGVFIPFLSENYYASKWCIQELTYANSREKPVIPVKLDSAEPGSGLGILLGAYRFLEYRNKRNLMLELQKSKEFINCHCNSPSSISSVSSPKKKSLFKRLTLTKELAYQFEWLIKPLVVFAVSLPLSTIISWCILARTGWVSRFSTIAVVSLLILLFAAYIYKYGIGPDWKYHKGRLTISKNNFFSVIADYDYCKGKSFNPSPWVRYTPYIRFIEIDKGITRIGNSAFEDCTDLELIDIPNYVTGIGKNAFRGCTKLKRVRIYGNPEKIIIDPDAFPTDTEIIYIPET